MQKISSLLRRAVGSALAALVLVTAAAPAIGADFKTDWQQAESELKAEKDKYNKIKKDKRKAEQAKKNLQNQETIIKGQIADMVQQINVKNGEIAESQQKIADKQTEIDNRWSDFQDRMLAMQIMHDSGAVAMITSAKSLYDLLNFSTALQQISQKDTEVLEEMNRQKLLLEEAKAELEEAKAELEAAEAELKNKQQQLADNIQLQDKNITAKDAEAKAQFQVVAEKQKKADQAEAQYEAWLKQNTSFGSGVCAEGFIWPLPPGARITTEFGDMQFYGGAWHGPHGGIDAAMPAGTPVYAAHNGTVASTSGHWTYGNIIMLDNGDGIATVYAHLLSKAVKQGQQVKQGEVIGYVGSTGNSTGNHLHFEVRVNGKRTNPRNFANPG